MCSLYKIVSAAKPVYHEPKILKKLNFRKKRFQLEFCQKRGKVLSRLVKYIAVDSHIYLLNLILSLVFKFAFYFGTEEVLVFCSEHFRRTILCVLTIDWCQFHQHFMYAFFVQKSFEQLFSS